MNDIKVSVLCITYNHVNYIRKCLDSLVSQKTEFKYEIIVHDDASTDGTSDIVREYAQKYPNLIIPICQKENQYSKKVLIPQTFLYPIAKGKYWAICEGDDYWCDDDKLQRQFEALECRENCGMAVHATQCVDEQGIEIARKFPEINLETGVISSQAILDYLPEWLFQASSYFFRAELYKQILAENSELCALFPVGDMRYIYMLAAYSDFYYDERIMSGYRVLALNSWTARLNKNKEKKFCEKMLNMCQYYCEFLLKERPDLSIESIKKRTIVQYEFNILMFDKKYKEMVKGKYAHCFKKLPVKHRTKILLLAYLPIIEKLKRGKGKNE